MRNTSNVVFGGVLVALGALWLMKSLDLFNFSWADVFAFWYYYLVVAGILLVVSGFTRDRIASSFAGIFISLAVVGGVTHGIHREIRQLSPFGWDAGSDGSVKIKKKRKKGSVPDGELVKGDFGYDLQPSLKKAKLKFAAGAGEFVIKGGASRLFEATAASTIMNYISNMKHNTADETATIDFGMEDGSIDLSSDNGENKVNVLLNDSISWDVELKFGAGDGKFDFASNNVENLDIKSGAAAVELKLGDKAQECKVTIQTGMASVEIKVPKNVGVEIETRGALSSNTFPGFKKSDKNKYRSPDYDSFEKKITIQNRGGLSSLEVRRY